MNDIEIQWHPVSDKMEKQEMKELVEQVSALSQKRERELADSVLEVSVRANSHVANELRAGGDNVCNALLELMEPEINKIVERKVQEAISNAVKSFRDLGVDNEKIMEILVKNYSLTSEEAGMYVK